MSGNVWEWVWDIEGDYSSGSQTDPTGPDSGLHRMFRGGSWIDFAWNARVSFRCRDEDTYIPFVSSFRLSRLAP